MKKLLSFFLVLSCLFALASCFGPAEENYTPGINADVLSFELKVGDKFDPLAGVSAINAVGKDVSDLIQVSHLVPLDENGCVKQSGTYQIKYVLELNGEKYNLYRTLTVIFELPESDSLVVNGDFELGALDPFTKSEFDNGVASLSVVENEGNHELQVEVIGVSWQQASPRVETNVFALEANEYYEVSFTARAADAKRILVQIGQLLPSDPWFRQLGDARFDLTNENQEFKFVFLADPAAADLDNIQLLFGFGTDNNGNAVATTCYLDNIKVEKYKMQSLLNAEGMIAGLAEEGPVAEAPGQAGLWYDQGGWCGAASTASMELNEGVLSVSATQPAGSCWFATQVFLYAGAMEAGNYTLSINLNLNKAGKVKFGADTAANTPIKYAEFEVAEGDNKLAVTFDVAEGQNVGLALQFGTESGGNIGDFEAVISDILLVRNGDVVIVDYADPSNLFGEVQGALNGGEGDSKANPNTLYVWWVQDSNWGCGPVVTTSFAYEEGVLSLKTSQTAEHYWFANQIFYTTKAIEAAGSHTLTFDLESEVAGIITINGVKTEIVVGKNEISVPFENAAGAAFTLSIQFGWEELGDPENISHTLVGANQVKLSNFAIDGAEAGEGEQFLGLPVSVANGEGNDYAIVNPGAFAFWFDQGWCNSWTNGSGEFANGIISMHIDEVNEWDAGCWFTAQMFYYGVVLQEAKDLTFNLTSDVAGKVTFNDEVFDIVAGTNAIKLSFAQGAQIRISFQAGANGVGNIGKAELVFSDFALVDPQGEEPQVQNNDIQLYLEGQGNNRNHIDGAGVWIWVLREPINLTNDNWGSTVVAATCDEFGVVDAFLSDPTETYARVYVVLSAGPAADAKIHIHLSLTVAGDKYVGNIVFVGGELEGAAQGNEPEEGGTISLYTEGEGNNRNHIDGAGVWIWVLREPMNLTNDNWGSAVVSATCGEFGVVEAFLSDPTETYARVYVVLNGAPEGAKTTIHLEITVAGLIYRTDLVFTNNELA